MKETLKKLRTALRPIYGDRETEAIIRIIFHHLKGWNLTDMLIHEPEPLSPFIKSEVDKILERLLRHEPIQYITGEARFHGLELYVTPDVLIPRPETAELVDIITDDAAGREDLHVLDIATGSGCIAVALARSLTFPVITALDISPAALKVAEENARRLKTPIRFLQADIFTWPPSPVSPSQTATLSIPSPSSPSPSSPITHDSSPSPSSPIPHDSSPSLSSTIPGRGVACHAHIAPPSPYQASPQTVPPPSPVSPIPHAATKDAADTGKFDIIVSNPPYIDESEKAAMDPNVLDYEPHNALFVPDADPLRFYIRIADVASSLLTEDGRLYFEINPRHASELVSILRNKGYKDVDLIRDSYGKDRFLRATRP